MSLSPQDAAREVLRRRRAKQDILDYIKYLAPEGLPDFHWKPASHHRLFADVINRVRDTVHERREDDDRHATSVPPGAAKSFYYSITAPTFLLAADPSLKILCVNAAESLAEDFARRRRQIMLSARWQRLSGTSLLADAKSLGFQGTKEGGGIYATGAGSTIQGLRADVLIGDDLVTGHEEAASLAQLDKKWNWYLSEARSRLRPGGAELLIATRWALLDPIGRVIRLTQKGDEKWHYLRIPMICDSDDDPLGREIGERLYPEYFTARMVKDAQRNPLIWNTLYQQNPAVSEYSWVGLDHIHIKGRDQFPESLQMYLGCDISLGVQKGDFTVFAVIGVCEKKKLWLLDLYRKQADPNESAMAFLALCEQYKPRIAWLENDNTSVMWGKIVDMEAKRIGVPNKLMLSKMKNRDKEVRASALRSLFMQDRVVLAQDQWTQVVLKELAEFPDGRNDDIVDAMGVVAKELAKLSGPKILDDNTAPEIKGTMQMIDGTLHTTQPLDDLWKPALNLGRRSRI
jgi:predicted phage terminase large subunit-like protein